jgi:hypothetical protein
MSVDYFDYKVVCLHCGNLGALRYSRDQWNRSEVSSSAFDIVYADPKPERSRLVCKHCLGKSVSVASEPSLSY